MELAIGVDYTIILKIFKNDISMGKRKSELSSSKKIAGVLINDGITNLAFTHRGFSKKIKSSPANLL